MASDNGSFFTQTIGQNLGFRNAYTVHNLNNRRYYSSIDATILLNGKEVDEIVQIQWMIEQQTMPLFGYNSYVWDDIAKGTRMVSGAFAINFTTPDYLNQVLNGTISNQSFINSGKSIEHDKHSSTFPKGFTIGIGYGSKDDKLGKAPCTFIENVIVKSCGQALDTQGANLVEMYQFIGRDKHESK